MAAAICISIGSFSLIIWIRRRDSWAYWFFSLTAYAAAFFAITELLTFSSTNQSEMIIAARWANAEVYGILIGLIWFLYFYFGTARRWLAWIITLVWTFLIIINFVLPYSLIFDQIDGIVKVNLPWNEHFYRLTGSRNIWSTVADIVSLVILLYFADASVRLWRKGNKNRTILVGGSTIFFMTAAGIHTPLVDMGIIQTPYMVTFAFLFIVVAMGFEISYSVIRSAQLSKEILANEHRWKNLLENVQLIVVQLDLQGKVIYANPYFLQASGYTLEEIKGREWLQLCVPQSQRAELVEAFKKLIEDRVHPHYQNLIVYKNGQERLIYWANVVLYNFDDAVEGVLSLGSDITDETEARIEIENLKNRLQDENIYLKEEIVLDHNYRDIIGKSDALKYALTRVEQVAGSDMTVLIEGETGVGKELFARAVHHNSPRKKQTLIKVNCAAIAPNLIESELFGHEKGSFTGAHKTRRGRFELADGGSIFLDEVGEISLEAQSKLLQIIEDGTFERVGGNKTMSVDVRVIAATNRNLRQEVEAGRFREDLYFRLNAYPISIPPLRKRSEDIPLLVENFVDQYTRKVGKKISKISKNTMDLLYKYDWPGNVRELRNVIERGVILSKDDKLHISNNLQVTGASKILQNGNLRNVHNDTLSLEQVEKEYIIKILDQCNWRINGASGAAKILKIHPNTLRNRMLKLGITKNTHH